MLISDRAGICRIRCVFANATERFVGGERKEECDDDDESGSLRRNPLFREVFFDLAASTILTYDLINLYEYDKGSSSSV